MYSRNMRYGRRAVDGIKNVSPSADNNNKTEYPEPPPNYRGMLYEREGEPIKVAEGIDRLAREDESYKEFEKNIRKKQLRNASERQSAAVFNEEKPTANKNNTGLHRLIDGLVDQNFDAEDILICAMIILMLNSGSEDDILMVIVLMMLL